MCKKYRSKFPEQCVHEYKPAEKHIVVKERGKTFSVRNNSNKAYLKVKIDNCTITGSQKRCDYLIVNCNDDIYFFIELKGADYGSGIKQLLQTIETFKNNSLLSDSIKIHAVLIAQSVPNIRPSASVHLLALLNRYSGTFIQSSVKYCISA